MSRTDPQLKLRLPADLKDRVEASAQQNGRSLNAEIVQVLLQYFPPQPSVDEVIDLIDYYVRISASPDAPAYRKGLREKILELKDRLEKGIDFSHPVNLEVMSPEEVENDEWHKEARAHRRDVERASDRGGVKTENFREFLRGPGMVWATGERMRRALEAIEEDGPDAGLRMLGLDELEFANRQEAHEVFREELRQMVDDYDRPKPRKRSKPRSS